MIDFASAIRQRLKAPAAQPTFGRLDEPPPQEPGTVGSFDGGGPPLSPPGGGGLQWPTPDGGFDFNENLGLTENRAAGIDPGGGLLGGGSVSDNPIDNLVTLARDTGRGASEIRKTSASPIDGPVSKGGSFGNRLSQTMRKRKPGFGAY